MIWRILSTIMVNPFHHHQQHHHPPKVRQIGSQKQLLRVWFKGAPSKLINIISSRKTGIVSMYPLKLDTLVQWPVDQGSSEHKILEATIFKEEFINETSVNPGAVTPFIPNHLLRRIITGNVTYSGNARSRPFISYFLGWLQGQGESIPWR
jgi:hypothetical protein